MFSKPGDPGRGICGVGVLRDGIAVSPLPEPFPPEPLPADPLSDDPGWWAPYEEGACPMEVAGGAEPWKAEVCAVADGVGEALSDRWLLRYGRAVYVPVEGRPRGSNVGLGLLDDDRAGKYTAGIAAKGAA